jgi:hypothetical protein
MESCLVFASRPQAPKSVGGIGGPLEPTFLVGVRTRNFGHVLPIRDNPGRGVVIHRCMLPGRRHSEPTRRHTEFLGFVRQFATCQFNPVDLKPRGRDRTACLDPSAEPPREHDPFPTAACLGRRQFGPDTISTLRLQYRFFEGGTDGDTECSEWNQEQPLHHRARS